MGTVNEAITWLDRQGETHFGAGAKVYKASLERFIGQRVDREPDTVEWVSENLETLAQRLAKAENISPNSLKTYISRARSVLAAFEDWSANPVGWSPRRNVATSAKKEARQAPTKAAKSAGEQAPPVAPPMPTTEKTLQDEVTEALIAIARWPKLRPFLMKGLTDAMAASTAGQKE